jgi:diguanylate cyclase (GGDEF)-like protein
VVPHAQADSSNINDEIGALDRHIFQLWGTLMLVSVALTLGMGIVVLPEYLRSRGQGQPIPQLVTGLILLVGLLNAYLWKQRRIVLRAREAILRERTRREMAEALAVLDPLTDSFNRRYMETVIAKEVSRADRLGTSLVFLMIDVDDFKTVNTRFGHATGDRVLRDVAELLKLSCRLSDTIVRYGGDEFLILLGGSNEQEAQVVLRRIQERVAAWNETSPIPDYRLDLSCGLSSYARGVKVNDIIDHADKRMYERKAGKTTRGATAGEA